MNQRKIGEIVERHQHWLNEDCKNWAFMRADFQGADLQGVDLRMAPLQGANLQGADLRRAHLQGANLRSANLRGADLRMAHLQGANLRMAHLRGASLQEADLQGADFRMAYLQGADLQNLKIDETTKIFIPLVCPDTGEFIGWKKARKKIICLKIPKEAKRSSATSRKCRCDKAKVISIQNIDGTDSGLTQICSGHDHSFIYEVGKTVKVNDFCEDRWRECAPGIHFFITREEAVNY